MNYCKKCVVPETRPSISFNEDGICSACQMASEKDEKIDWTLRYKELINICNKYRRINDWEYDCIVPVSGGKDSIYQVHTIKNEFNMNPLCITWKTPTRTPLGYFNLEILKSIGVDHIDFTPNPDGMNSIIKESLIEFGDPSLLDHLAIYNLIPGLALRFKIPLVIWGENPYMEYGGRNSTESNKNIQDSDFINNHHVMKGKGPLDWVTFDRPRRQIASLIPPDEYSLAQIQYMPIYLGYYKPWDAKHNLKIAQSYGYKTRGGGPLMGLYDYADIDCSNIIIHHYIKWLKFGFNRITDHASNEIRKGRMTREQAILLIKDQDGLKPPKEFIQKLCNLIGISNSEFWEILEKFRNKEIWKNDGEGWYIKDWIGGDKQIDNFPHVSLNEEEKIFFNEN
jgi:N-acetyl sugar amidotransferase